MCKSKACIYLRLSREDGDVEESNSISNQRELIHNYANKQGIEILKEFVDDGYSGATYNRPQFNEMIRSLKNKEFDTLIVKDLSRFGRDYIGAGRYIQKIFPDMQVRFISITDNYDSQNADMNDTHLILPIKNFINDSYCRDISNKVRSAQKVKREKGDYIGAFAPYGYKKSKENKNKLEIDEKAAEVVKRIFGMKLLGYSSNSIAYHLNDLGIDSPLIYKEKSGLNFNGGFRPIKGGKWSVNSINRIIRNRVYIGYMEQGKRIKLNYKSEKEICVSPNDWVIVKNCHEKIVSKEIFNIANNLLDRDVWQARNKNPDIFAGLIFCKDCGSPLIRREIKSGDKKIVQYICSNYNKNGSCTRHAVKKEELLEVIKDIFTQYISFQELLYKKIKNKEIKLSAIDYEGRELIRQKEKYEAILSCLYSDLEDKILTKNEFSRFREAYKSKIKEIDKEIQNRENIKSNVYKLLEENKKWINEIKRNKQLNKIDRLSLVMLVNKIVIGENKEIQVVFNHAEEFKILNKMIANDKELDSLKNISSARRIS